MNETTPTWRDTALSVPCEYCRAPIGVGCDMSAPNGFHFTRLTAFETERANAQP